MKTRVFALILALFLVMGTAMACNIASSGFVVELRNSDSSYSSSISSPINTNIDIRTQFHVDSHNGSDCPATIGALAKIYRYNNTTGNWELFKTTITKTQNLSDDLVIFVWSDEFNTGNNSNYTRFKAEGQIMNSTNVLNTLEAFVDVINNTCSGITINTSAITINENTTSTRTFTLENNTNQQFHITNANLFFTNSLIQSGTINYDEYQPSYSTRNMSLGLSAGSVTSNSTITGTITVEGYIGSTFCSSYDIGRKNFDVTVTNTTTNDGTNYYDDYYNNGNDYYGTSTSANCGEMTLETKTVYLDEGETQKTVQTLWNNSTMRFEITSIALNGAEVVLENYSNDRFIQAGQAGNIITRITAPNVTQNESYSASIKVSGRFSNGRVCSGNDINSQFSIAVANNSGSVNIDCSALQITLPEKQTIETYGTVLFSISNNTKKSATIFVEGTVQALPTIISIPSGTSISKELNITMQNQTGYVTLRSLVDGCVIAGKTITLTNSQTGELASATITTNTQKDANNGALSVIVEINNPTSRVFFGSLSATTVQGGDAETKNVTVSPGKNYYTLKIIPTYGAGIGSGKVIFNSGGKQITSDYDLYQKSQIAGLFTFGELTGSQGTIGIIILMIIAVLIIIGIITVVGKTNQNKEERQAWI